MGTGIGIVASRVAGLNVTFVDPKEAQLKSAQTMIHKWCDKEIGKGRVTEEQKGQIIERIGYGDQLSDLKDADFIVEAATENFDLKKVIF